MAKYGIIYDDGTMAEIVVGDHIGPLMAAARFAEEYNSDINDHFVSIVVGKTDLPVGSHPLVADDGYLGAEWDYDQGRSYMEGETHRALFAVREAIEATGARYIVHPYADGVISGDGARILAGDWFAKHTMATLRLHDKVEEWLQDRADRNIGAIGA